MPTAPVAPPERGAGIWLGMLVLYLVWGSTYLAIALAVDTLPPFLMAAARFSLAGLVLLSWSLARHRSAFAWPTRREWRDSTIVGGLLLGGGMGMVALGELTVPSGIAALMIALMPVWVAVIGAVVLGERLPRLAGLGIVVGFLGVAILVAPSVTGASGALDPLGLAALIISPICWSSGSLFASHRARLPRQPLVATGLQMVTGGAVLLLMSVIAGEPGQFDAAAVTASSVGAFLYLVVIGSLLAFTTYGWLLRKAPLPLISTYAYVNPIVAVILGAIVLNEPIEPRTLLAGAVIVGGVALIVTARGRMARPRPVADAVADAPSVPAAASTEVAA